MDLPVITQVELIEHIKTKLESRKHISTYHHFKVAPDQIEPSAYALILGAGFSYGVVPLVGELMKQTIGDYYYPDQDQSSVERHKKTLQKISADFWEEFNQAAIKNKLSTIELNSEGLPREPGAAYQYLFTYEALNALFTLSTSGKPIKKSFLERLQQFREKNQVPIENLKKGEAFMKGFLRYILDPGSEHGYGSTGRNELNSAHIYLASLLEAQQLGLGWRTCAFSRTLLTTNFDTLLQNALQMVNLLYRITDRPERGLDYTNLHEEEGSIHLVYVHGSILRHNPASTINELDDLANRNVDVLRSYLESRDIIVIGYSGWNDGLMAALRSCDSKNHMIYWCDISPEPNRNVADFLIGRAGRAMYAHIEKGANDLMRALYEALIPAEIRRDPIKRYQDWIDLTYNRKLHV